MNLKKIVAIFALSVFCVSSFAQNGDGFGFGVRAGINMADFTGSTGASRVGFFGGVFGDYTIKRFGFELGLYYSEQGADNIVEQGIAGNRNNYRFDYLNLQLLVKYQVFNGFRVFIGPQFSYLLNAKRSNDSYTEPFKAVMGSDLGITAGVGYTFTFGLDLAASYSRGFFDIFKDDRLAYSSTFRVTAGWRF